MRVTGFAVIVLFLMEAAFPAAADPAALATATKPSSLDQPPSLDQVVCKSYAPPTGTRLGARRECRTQREWNDLARISQDYLTVKQTNSLEAKCLSLNACD